MIDTATNPSPAIIDIDDSRAYLGGIGRTHIYALIKNGDLKPVKIGRRTFIAKAELDRYIATLGPAGSADAK